MKTVSPSHASAVFVGFTAYFYLLLLTLHPFLAANFAWNPVLNWFVTGYFLFVPIFANRGSGPMWAEYLVRNLNDEVPVVPVSMLLISGASDMNTPVTLVREWFESVEAPHGKRMEVFDASGHAPHVTETARFVETVRAFGAGFAGGRGQ
jgi:pimeloyl-ACP methyl ester carboxylesterase